MSQSHLREASRSLRESSRRRRNIVGICGKVATVYVVILLCLALIPLLLVLAIAVLVLLAVILSVLLLTCCCLPCLCCGTKEDGVDWSGKFAVGRFVMDVSFLRPYIYWILGREEELNETERISEVCYERNCYGPAATQRCTYYIV